MCRDKCVEFTLDGESIRVMVPSLESSAKDFRKCWKNVPGGENKDTLNYYKYFSCHIPAITHK